MTTYIRIISRALYLTSARACSMNADNGRHRLSSLFIKTWVQYRPAMIIRIALVLMFAAFAVFVSVDLLLGLAVPGLPELMTRLGLAALLTAFALLLTAGLAVVIKAVIAACFDYFSAGRRLQRRLWFIQARREQLKQLFYFRTVQIRYFNERKRKRLLSVNNRRHLRALSKAIDKDLLAIKQQLATTIYLQLQQEHARYRAQQDSEALVKLQQKIATLV